LFIKIYASKDFNPVDSFKSQAMNPRKWLECAENMEAAIALLRPPLAEYCQRFSSDFTNDFYQVAFTARKLIGPFCLLSGYALECIFKGIIVGKGYQCIDKDNVIKFKNHNLLELAKQAGITPGSFIEEYTLKELTKQTVWKGRYPTAMKWNKQYTKEINGKVEDHSVTNFDIDIIDSLYAKSKEVLVKLLMRC
jgi:hypothetical protein